MKKLTNTIYGKESKYHVREGERAETISSEKYHTKYDPDIPRVAALPPSPPTGPIVEDIPRAETKMLPEVLHETIIPIEREEIQPVIHRDIEKTEIVHVTSPKYQSSVLPTLVQERVLPSEYLPEIRHSTREAEDRLRQLESVHQSTRDITPVKREVIERPPLIEEIVHRRVIEEIQPVIHKEVVEPRVIKEIKPIYERIVEAPVVMTHEYAPQRLETFQNLPPIEERGSSRYARLGSASGYGGQQSMYGGQQSMYGGPSYGSSYGQQSLYGSSSGGQQSMYGGQQSMYGGPSYGSSYGQSMLPHHHHHYHHQGFGTQDMSSPSRLSSGVSSSMEREFAPPMKPSGFSIYTGRYPMY